MEGYLDTSSKIARCSIQQLAMTSEEGWDGVDLQLMMLRLAKVSEEILDGSDVPIFSESAVDPLLQTRTVGYAEVRANLDRWIPPMAEELSALTVTHKAVDKVKRHLVDELKREGVDVQIIPGKLDFYRKSSR